MSFASSTNAVVGSLTQRDTVSGDQGQYFVAVNPTPGTGIIATSAASLAETTPSLTIFNGGNATIYLMYLRMLVTVISAGGAQLNFTHSVDQGNRFSSGGTALTVSNVNSLSANTSAATINFGALTATAKSAKQRNLGNLQFRSVIDVAGDKYELQYGEGATGSVNPLNGSAPGHYVIGVPPVVIQPQSTYLINFWKTSSSTGVTVEIEIAYVEK